MIGPDPSSLLTLGLSLGSVCLYVRRRANGAALRLADLHPVKTCGLRTIFRCCRATMISSNHLRSYNGGEGANEREGARNIEMWVVVPLHDEDLHEYIALRHKDDLSFDVLLDRYFLCKGVNARHW